MNDSNWREQILEVHQPLEAAVRRYSAIAPVYELWAHLAESHPRRRVLELAAPRDGERVLEVAIGTGAQLARLALCNPSGMTVGIELAKGMLDRAGRHLAGSRPISAALVQANALMLPFADVSFDLLVNSYMLDLLARDQIPIALEDFKRVLRPGGRLVLSNMTKGEHRLHRGWDWLYRHGLNVTANCRGVLAAPVLVDLGFSEVRREYMAQALFPTEIVTATKTF